MPFCVHGILQIGVTWYVAIRDLEVFSHKPISNTEHALDTERCTLKTSQRVFGEEILSRLVLGINRETRQGRWAGISRFCCEISGASDTIQKIADLIFSLLPISSQCKAAWEDREIDCFRAA